MHTVALLGPGTIGEAICGLLSASGRYQVRAADVDPKRAAQVASTWQRVEPHTLQLDNPESMKTLLNGCAAVISALPYHCNAQVAAAARAADVHYLDLTEDVVTTRKVIDIAKGAKKAFLPQCGLAPGFISIAAGHLAKSFEKLDSIKMRVGALPLYPTNRFKYNLSWSTEGLINQYGNLCTCIDAGVMREVNPLEGYERISIDGIEYEAFNTSGGLGSLAGSLLGKIRELDYKTLRYPGHRDLIQFLMNDLRFNEDRATLKHVLERGIGFTSQDKCVVFVEVRGFSGDRILQSTYASTIYHTTLGGSHFCAIQLTTAAGVCAPLDLLLETDLGKRSGFVKCEELNLHDFLNNEFGKYYRDERAMAALTLPELAATT